jgi:hypothetical protein
VIGNRPEKASRILVALQGEFERAIVLKDLHREGRNSVALIHKLTDKAKQLEKRSCQPGNTPPWIFIAMVRFLIIAIADA